MVGEAGAVSVGPVRPGRRAWTRLFHQLRRRALPRLGWGLADQAVSSLSNVAVSFYLVHTLGAAQFGAFSLAYVTYGFALNASRGLSTDPLMVRFSGSEPHVWRRAVAGCTGTALTTGIVTGALALLAAALLSGTTAAAFVALGLNLPGLMLQDSWRFSFFALGRGSQAFLNDVIWVIGLALALVILRMTGRATVFWVVFAWGACGTMAAVVGPLQSRVIPDLRATRTWLVRHRDLGPRYLAEGVVSNASSQIRGYGTGIMLGLSAVGYLQAANTLMGPPSIIYSATGLVLIPEGARILQRRPDRLGPFCILVGAAMAVIGAAWGTLLLIASPRGLGSVILGPIWRPTYPLILPATITVVASACSLGAGVGLHVLGASRRSLRVTVGGVAFGITCSLVGTAEWGVAGTMWGMTAAACLGTALFWWQLRVALRDVGLTATSGLLSIRALLPRSHQGGDLAESTHGRDDPHSRRDSSVEGGGRHRSRAQSPWKRARQR